MRSLLRKGWCWVMAIAACGGGSSKAPQVEPQHPYSVVDTGQQRCFDASKEISCPGSGTAFSAQDGQVQGAAPAYRDNGDGTVSDLVTGLMWVKARGDKVGWEDAKANAGKARVGGYKDWRLPSIKELYSLINFNGIVRATDKGSASTSSYVPYMDAQSFEFKWGGLNDTDRVVDCQDWSATEYVSTTMFGDPTVFGVNFCDGRIKGYPKETPPRSGTANKLYVRYVRGNPAYGKNNFAVTGDTVTDQATGLTWQQADSGKTLNWQDSLAYCDTLVLAGHDDWRLPNAKELQSIVDYSRSPKTTNSAAIDAVFAVTTTESYYWSSTTHLEFPGGQRIPSEASDAVYFCFGRCLGYVMSQPGGGSMPAPNGPPRGPGSSAGPPPPIPGGAAPVAGAAEWLDVHGAGAQRSDPKAGDPATFPAGSGGPQGDDVRILNYARCVRDAM